MENPVIQTDLAQVLGQINQKLDKLSENVTELKIGQAEIKGDIKRLDSDISAIKEDIKDIKGSQKAQIWTLIGIVITAVIGLIGALGKMVFFPNP